MSGVRNDSYMLSSVCSTSQFVSVSIQCPSFSKRVYQCEVWFLCKHSEEVQQSRCTSETSGSLIEGSFLSYVLGAYMWAELPYVDLQFPYGIPLQGSVTLSYPQLLEYETS